MSDLIEARDAGAQALQDHMEQFHGVCLPASQWDAAMSAALAALRETHHLVPKDQGPDADDYVHLDAHDYYNLKDANGEPYSFTNPPPVEAVSALTRALEKRHD